MLTQTQRVAILPTVDRLAQPVGQYTAYELHALEYVGTVDEIAVAEGVGTLLEEYGYEFCGLAALKYYPDTTVPDDGSYRKVDPDNPRWQWHVHLFENDAVVEIYSHYEYRPDLVALEGEDSDGFAARVYLASMARAGVVSWGEARSRDDALDRLIEHYRPTWDVHADDPDDATYFLGEACDDVHDLTGGE